MSDRCRLEHLKALRERRERQAAFVLQEQRRRYRQEADRLDALDLSLERERGEFDRLEQGWFEAAEGETLSPAELEQARQALDDHYHRQAELVRVRAAVERERSRLLDECERHAETWKRRAHAREALEKLLARRQQTGRIKAESRLEADLEDGPVQGGPLDET
ncbi:hypothetical protein HOP51_09690 [Halomonas sp. MCCC 1A11036]|uniref:Type III secretion protein n=1 Tax=Billgrantia zhangzhouensis TaxID=2733481 RepID=A0ABS9AF67_9GAMM|nr:hypothetical protein [Halomonas zhangzhouensis]MCE8020374.1 hypothetical protein [Halomonas zhangzhouensis]